MEENGWGKVFIELFKQLAWKYKFYVLGIIGVFFVFELIIVALTVLVTIAVLGYGK